MLKRLLLALGFILASISTMSYASTATEHKPTIKSFTQALYTKLVAGKDYVVSTAHKHPFIVVTIAVVLMSKKTRKALCKFPKNLWNDIQEYPIAMALLGGFLLSYILA